MNTTITTAEPTVINTLTTIQVPPCDHHGSVVLTLLVVLTSDVSCAVVVKLIGTVVLDGFTVSVVGAVGVEVLSVIEVGGVLSNPNSREISSTKTGMRGSDPYLAYASATYAIVRSFSLSESVVMKLCPNPSRSIRCGKAMTNW